MILKQIFRFLFVSTALLLPMWGTAQTMTVTLLGTGAPDPSIDRFGPSTLVEAGSEKLLFDAGRGVSQRLWQRHIPLGQVNVLFLTHLHSDHTVGIPDLWLTGCLPTPYGRRSVPLLVFGPEGTEEMMSFLEKAFQRDIRFRLEGPGHLPETGTRVFGRDVSEGLVYEHNGVRVTVFVVDHGPIIRPAFGYRIDYGGRSVVISGDTRPSENLIKFAKGTDLLIHEVMAARPELLKNSAAARGIMALHTSPEEAGGVFERVKPKLVVYTHVSLLTTDPAIPAPTTADLIPRTRMLYAGPIVLGEDLMTVFVGDKVEVRKFEEGASH